MSGCLKQHGDSLWTVADPSFRLLGLLPLGARMTVVRLADAGLWLHSPIQLSDALAAEIRELGPVRYLVAPNKVHHMFMQDAARRFPEARTLAAPELPKKRRDIHFDLTLKPGEVSAMNAEFDTLFVDGLSFLNEVVFLHRASRTLILTDLCFHIKDSHSRLSTLAYRALDAWQRFGPTRTVRAAVRDKAAFRASIQELLSWDFDRVIVSHGDVLESGGSKAFRDAFAYLEK